MKEAIKVQSVTIIVINGVSEAFEVHVGLYRDGELRFWSWRPVGENQAKSRCVAGKVVTSGLMEQGRPRGPEPRQGALQGSACSRGGRKAEKMAPLGRGQGEVLNLGTAADPPRGPFSHSSMPLAAKVPRASLTPPAMTAVPQRAVSSPGTRRPTRKAQFLFPGVWQGRQAHGPARSRGHGAAREGVLEDVALS